MALTKLDKEEIELIVEEKIEPLKEQVRNLPTRDEFFTAMSELMGELKTSREEQVVLSYQSSDHRKRVEALEEIHPNGKHASQ